MKNKKLHIVYLDFDDIKNPLLGAGQARATVEVGSRLAKKGHTITVISSRYPDYKDRKENGITYKHIGLGSGNIRLNNAAYILSLPFAVMQLKADIIIECFTAPISTLFSPIFTKIPVVALPTSFEAERFSKIYRLPFNLIEKFGFKFYKYALPFTNDMEKKMKSINPKIISKTIPNGVNKKYFAIKRKKSKHILYLGRFDIHQKGIDLLLKSFSRVISEIKYPLLLAGYGPDEEKIKSKIKNLNLSKYVKVFGRVKGNAKQKILAEAAFVAFPSRSEGFSLVSLEAIASGLPLVSFNIPSLSWANKNVALKANAFDTEGYSKLLLKASEKDINLKMSKNAKKFACKYSWDFVANCYESFFCSVV